MRTNLAVGHKAPIFLRMEPFQRSRGPDYAKSHAGCFILVCTLNHVQGRCLDELVTNLMDYSSFTTSFVYQHEGYLESQNHLARYGNLNVKITRAVLQFILIITE